MNLFFVLQLQACGKSTPQAPTFPKLETCKSLVHLWVLWFFIPFFRNFLFSYNEGQVNIQNQKENQASSPASCACEDCPSPEPPAPRVITSAAPRHPHVFPPGSAALTCNAVRATGPSYGHQSSWCREQMGPRASQVALVPLQPSRSTSESQLVALGSHRTSTSQVCRQKY